MKIIINGANGRMGKALAALIAQDNNLSLSGEIIPSSSIETISASCKQAELIIDFSTEEGVINILHYAQKFSLPLLIGTTNISIATMKQIELAAKKIPIIYAANTSIGANLLNYLTAKLASLTDYDTEIIEKHHKDKIDAPSGTALMLGKTIARSRYLEFSQHAIFDRVNKGKRKKQDISFASIRAGNIFGEHEVIFAGDTELITLNHQAISRLAFAQGAIIAAKWLSGQIAGRLYNMSDVLEIGE